MSNERPAPFCVIDLISWAEVAEFASQAADPNWAYEKHGIVMDYESPFPNKDDPLPNGFRFPSAAMSDFQRAVYYQAVSRYEGPDPTACKAFDRVRGYVLAQYGEDLTIGTARRVLGDLIRVHKLSVQAAGELPLEAAMDRLDASDGKERSEGGTQLAVPTPRTPRIPLSLLDMPAIRAAVSDLHRILEHPTPTNEAARRVFQWATARTTLGEQCPDAACAAALIQAGVEWVQFHFGEHTRSDCPEITDSQFDLTTKAALLELRRELLSPFASHSLANDAGLRVQFLVFLADILVRITPPTSGTTPANGRQESGPVGASAGLPVTRVVPTDPETKGEIMGDSDESLRTPAELLQAFGKAAARFSTTGLRVAAFRNTARADGLTTIPASLIPKNEHGQPICGQLNIGGTARTTVTGCVTYYGVGGARLTSAGGEMNVGFVIYGRSPEDDAVARFRELGSEAGVVSHLHGFGPEIQSYDNPLVFWSLVVYETLQGSAWLSERDMVSETPSHQFNPFTASMEVLKRLTAQPKTGQGEVVPVRNPTEPATSTGTKSAEGEKPRLNTDRPSPDPGRPSQDRQNDILAAISAAGMPLMRPELIGAMKLKTEGKLGANLAWMVANNILVNIPQRGYWPADRPVPE